MLVDALITYMANKGYRISTRPGEVNIIYLEGGNADGTPNSDAPDRWNDRRIVIVHDSAQRPEIVLNVEATSEPGTAATFSVAARKRRGVARVALTQYLEKWKVGYHKRNKNHPALVQAGDIKVFRDFNRDGLRTGDNLLQASGINQHSTRPYLIPTIVGVWSEGCLVGRVWAEHLSFMDLVKSDPRYVADPEFLFDTTIIDTSDFHKFRTRAV